MRLHLALAALALALGGCNLIFGLDEAEPRGPGGGGAGGDDTSTSSSTTEPTATTTTAGGGGAASTTTSTGGAGGDEPSTAATTGAGGEGGGEACPVVHELVETFEGDTQADPDVWEEVFGTFFLGIAEGEDGPHLRFQIDGTGVLRSWPFDPPWSLRQGDVLELSARSRAYEREITSARLSIGTIDGASFTHKVDLAIATGFMTASRTMIAEFDVDDALVYVEADALGEATFDVDDIVVRIRRCP